jgi:secondary thiamine-phosphate synthase enzyme
MTAHTHRFTVETRGENDMHDITSVVSQVISESGCQSGLVNVFVRHTTAVIMIGEYEPGLVHDIPVPIERIAPADLDYRHNQLNHDDNAHSHLVGSLMGPSETVPFAGAQMLLGTWQQIILLELDTHPRNREVVVQVLGE